MAETISTRPDFYIAAMGRSGSTALSNWLTREPDEIVLIEPFLLRTTNSRLLRIQFDNLGLPISGDEWNEEDASGLGRFERIVAPRLQGRRWAVKEVLAEEHFAFIEAFEPPRVLITVRDIVDVALSFFEKHRVQGNLERFSDQWVIEYCSRESAGILQFKTLLEERRLPHLVIRYEDLIRSDEVREGAARFVDWSGGGAVDANLASFDRGFEVMRHGTKLSGNGRGREERELDASEIRAAERVLSLCNDYQRVFDYR